ncbi:MAG: hypothetical protein AB8I08_28100 [Sandaracinaceae bacterium]
MRAYGTRIGCLLVVTCMVAQASPVGADDEPGSRAAGRVVEVLDRIRERMQETRYQHHRTVRERRGQYFFDCSGMVQWVLSRASRRSTVPLEPGERPLAIDFVRRIERAPVDRYRGGWRRIARLEDVRPGDVFAWRRPPDFQSANTGHVGFVVETPQPVAGRPGYFTARIADASRYTHQDDTRPWPGPGGFGHGTILFSVDEAGEPTGYGWAGLRSRGTWETDVVFGRVGP